MSTLCNYIPIVRALIYIRYYYNHIREIELEEPQSELGCYYTGCSHFNVSCFILCIMHPTTKMSYINLFRCAIRGHYGSISILIFKFQLHFLLNAFVCGLPYGFEFSNMFFQILTSDWESATLKLPEYRI